MEVDLKDPKAVRTKLNITQEHAARLLGISKNTWIRWERGEFKCDQEAVSMLNSLAKQLRPEACWNFRNPKKWDWAVFDGHVRVCKDCQRLVKYLAANLKK